MFNVFLLPSAMCVHTLNYLVYCCCCCFSFFLIHDRILTCSRNSFQVNVKILVKTFKCVLVLSAINCIYPFDLFLSFSSHFATFLNAFSCYFTLFDSFFLGSSFFFLHLIHFFLWVYYVAVSSIDKEWNESDDEILPKVNGKNVKKSRSSEIEILLKLVKESKLKVQYQEQSIL